MSAICNHIVTTISVLTDSSLLHSFCDQRKAKLKLSKQNSGGVLFSLVGEDGRILTPMFSSGRGLLEHLYIVEADPLANLREVL